MPSSRGELPLIGIASNRLLTPVLYWSKACHEPLCPWQGGTAEWEKCILGTIERRSQPGHLTYTWPRTPSHMEHGIRDQDLVVDERLWPLSYTLLPWRIDKCPRALSPSIEGQKSKKAAILWNPCRY